MPDILAGRLVDELLVRLANGTRIFVPASLDSITTYVLLEQETWFEKEFGFLQHLIRPGSTVIDIGANLGTYALAMARLVGSAGHVYAYEPTSQTRLTLERSREANAARQLRVIGEALSDGQRTGRIVFGQSSELNHLGEGGEGEAVEVTSLDLEAELHGWAPPDFIKIDAEGEEVSILRGGSRVLAEGSPILLMELKAGTAVNAGLVAAVEALGYGAYRLVPSLRLLVPLGDPAHAEGHELNFFAIKPDRAAELERQNLLVRAVPELALDGRQVERALATLRGQPFAAGFQQLFAASVEVDRDYAAALACYDASRNSYRPVAERYATLAFALQVLGRLCERDGRIARLTTLARLAGELGRRDVAVAALKTIIDETAGGGIRLGEPFWPAAPRYDRLPQAGKPAAWFLAGVLEQFELLRQYSGVFGGASPSLRRLAGSSFASRAVLRRQRLQALLAGEADPVDERLLVEADDHLNASLWRDGTVDRLAMVSRARR